jgi:hypothetical protein
MRLSSVCGLHGDDKEQELYKLAQKFQQIWISYDLDNTLQNCQPVITVKKNLEKLKLQYLCDGLRYRSKIF